jgi:hypothetical protein
MHQHPFGFRIMRRDEQQPVHYRLGTAVATDNGCQFGKIRPYQFVVQAIIRRYSHRNCRHRRMLAHCSNTVRHDRFAQQIGVLFDDGAAEPQALTGRRQQRMNTCWPQCPLARIMSALVQNAG